jgi:F5/8 type C domain
METLRNRTKRRHVREKATIDHLVQNVYEPKAADQEHAVHSPTTSTGLPVEDQVRKVWDPRREPSPFLSIKPQITSIRNKCRMHGITNLSRLRKRLLETDAAPSTQAAGEIDIAGCATIAYSSENPAHPVEHLLDGRSGPGATRWMSARPDAVEHIVVEFHQLQPISRLVYEVEEAERERTQELRVEVSEDGGQTYRQILVQEYTFSPEGATYRREEQRFNLLQVSHLRLRIVPNKNGSGAATLTALRLFG